MAVGVALALVAALGFALGSVLEKRGVDHVPPFSLRELVPVALSLLSSGWWLAGAIISVAAVVPFILAYSYISISIVQSVGVAGVVLLIVISRAGFGEHLQWSELSGLGLAVVSVILVSLSLTRSADASGGHYATRAVIVAMILTIVVITGVIVGRNLWRLDDSFMYGSVSGLLYGLAGLGEKGLSVLIARRGWLGMMDHMFATPFPYVLISSWLLGLVVFQLGIQRCRVGVVAPLSAMVASVYLVAVGTPVFGEQLPREIAELVFRLVGFAGIVIGSAIVGWGGTRIRAE